MSAKSITGLLLAKCGDSPPTGDYDNRYGWRASCDIPPFLYNKKRDIICLTTWEGGHYSIDYVNVPQELAGVPLTFTRIESFYRPCDYRGKGSVHMYKTHTGIVRSIEARLRRGLRYMARRWLARKYAQDALGHDIGSYLSTFI